MYCEHDKRECKAVFCRSGCIHDKKAENKKNTINDDKSAFNLSDVGKNLVQKHSITNRMIQVPKKKYKPVTMQDKSIEEKPEIVFAERLKKTGECSTCGHYKPCRVKCLKPIPKYF